MANEAVTWLMTCVHIVNYQVATVANHSVFEGTSLRIRDTDLSLPLHQDGQRRYTVVEHLPTRTWIDALAVRLSPSEASALGRYGRYERRAIAAARTGDQVLAKGFSGLSGPRYAYRQTRTAITQVVGSTFALRSPSAPGMSGGPVESESGLIGLVFGDTGTAPNYESAIAVSLHTLRDSLLI